MGDQAAQGDAAHADANQAEGKPVDPTLQVRLADLTASEPAPEADSPKARLDAATLELQASDLDRGAAASQPAPPVPAVSLRDEPEDPSDEDPATLKLDRSKFEPVVGLRLPSLAGITIHSLIGEGGQAKVYAGRHDFLGREVAVKILERGLQQDLADRFQREAKLLAGMQHPFIVGCYDAGTTSAGQCYIVMELIDGPDLSKWIAKNGPMGLNEALTLVRDVAGALAHAQTMNIIHRDVKPQNILLQPLPTPEAAAANSRLGMRPKLADLGLARVNGEGNEGMTATGVVMGTPATMALEQFDDPESVDFRADIYGLGCVLFHALAGQGAYEGLRPSKIFMMKSNEGAPRVCGICPGIPKDVSKLVSKMMQADRLQRPQSYAELIDSLEALLNQLRRAAPKAPLRARGRWLAAAGLGLAVGAGFWFKGGDVIEPAFQYDLGLATSAAPARSKSESTESASVTGGLQPDALQGAPQEVDAASLGAASEGLEQLRIPASKSTAEFPLDAAKKLIPKPTSEPAGLSATPALKKGESKLLFDAWDSLDGMLAGWERSPAEGVLWGGFDGLLNQPMATTQASATASYGLPGGAWSLEGMLRIQLPFGYPKGRAYRGGLSIDFEAGRALHLELKAGLGANRASWSAVGQMGDAWALRGAMPGWQSYVFENRDWVPFQLEWRGQELLMGLANGPLESIDISPYALGPARSLSLRVEAGSAQWKDFLLRGL